MAGAWANRGPREGSAPALPQHWACLFSSYKVKGRGPLAREQRARGWGLTDSRLKMPLQQ